ncbi:MAG: hypothetical protein NUV77_11750 [Thermoguttaceae bacterium]|nr:hypothetical protein [Thermoguttaceae bacterium]
MRPWLRWVVTFVLLAMAGLGVWAYCHRLVLECQWRAYSIGAAEAFDKAAPELAWFDRGPDRPTRLRELMAKWGTGNARFDAFVARYVGSAESSEALREAFSLELGWREELLDRWAHYWSWRAPQEPDRHIAETLSYLDLLAASTPPKPLTWREVLDLQAIFTLSGHAPLARRLKPDTWHERYRNWRQTVPGAMPHVGRPEQPLPDGIGVPLGP